ncbi:MAG: phosphonopyruvate decarboxylase, partial [Flavobacteriales bacterium]|nr:phosphonopyruvate decarboxylase [Flavobacteriales bacterium]
MIDPKLFFEKLLEEQIEFFTGVPDSLLKDICAYISENSKEENHVISANEGGAIGLAVGNYLATRKVPLVYMQNSGLGNAVNPILSIADEKVYGIPMILMVGWRGEPGYKDEPQHVK